LAAAPTAPRATLAAQEPVSGTIEVTGVGYAADGVYIIVRFKAPPQVARRWIQGTVSVTDEATGGLYNEIPTMPLIGPLLGHPAQAGQPGYVMLVNTPPGLPPGSLVTVVLGDFRQEHVRVQ
jgi:DNA-binding beta-propeller fold protein YncE